MDHAVRRGRGTRRLAPVAIGLVAAAVVAGCHANGGTLLVLNRTSVPVALEQIDGLETSTMVVEACSERTIIWKRVWGGMGEVGVGPVEPVPAGAYVMPLPGDWLHMPMEEGVVTATLLLTPDGIGVSQDSFTPSEVTSGGTFPPDPGSGSCAGVPPAMSAGGVASPVASPSR